MTFRVRTTASFSVGRPSWENSIEKLAVVPPGTGGVATDRTRQITNTVTIHVNDTEIPLCSATHTAVNQYMAAVDGLYRICPNGTAKLASSGRMRCFSVQTFRLSANAAEEEAVVSPIRKVENDFFQSSMGEISAVMAAPSV